MSKKTETLEIRICPDLKAKLSDHCKDRNQPMSAVVRDLVQSELSGFAPNLNSSKDITMTYNRTRSLRDMAIAGATLVALGLIWNTVTRPPAIAQASARITFAEMDLNEDGIVTRDEYAKFETQGTIIEGDIAASEDLPAACMADFGAMESMSEEDGGFGFFDGDKDGQIVFAEVQTKISTMLKEEFAAIDEDQSGFLSKDEFQARPNAGEVAQEDGISEACFAALMEQFPDAQDLEVMDLKIEFAALDANRDNQISQAEFLAN